MILKVILQVICAFLWFWASAVVCVLYSKKNGVKKEKESYSSYMAYGITKGRGYDFIHVDLPLLENAMMDRSASLFIVRTSQI